MAGKKLSTKQKEYRKEYSRLRKNIKRVIDRAEARGYDIPKNIIPKQLKEMKSVTKKDIEKLKKLTPEKIYGKLTYTEENGKKIKGTERRKQERKKSQKRQEVRDPKIKKELDAGVEDFMEKYVPKGMSIEEYARRRIDTYPIDEHIVNLYRNQVNNVFSDSDLGDFMDDWLDRIIEEHGVTSVAIMIRTAQENGYILTYTEKYSGEAFTEYFTAMQKFLPSDYALTEEEKDILTQILFEQETGFDI